LFLYQGCYLFTLIPYDLSFYLDLETYFLINSSLILIKTNKILLKKNDNNNKINPWWLTGITDGDGNFNFSISKTKSIKNKNWDILFTYNIVASDNLSNLKMLNQINNYFGTIGKITKVKNENTLSLRINGIKNCLIVREHFLKYPLLTYKLVYFNLWSKALSLAKTRKELNYDSWQKVLLKIVSLKYHFLRRN